MTIRSLLLGSVAGLIGMSGAYAADGPVAGPEPAEYVRVCDVYGAGYFYIPGTETCFRLGGYIRFDASVGDGGRVFDGRTATDAQYGDPQHALKVNTRFTFRTWTGQETELGTLKTFTETRFNYPNGGPTNLTLNFAWIQLGGLRVGKDESTYDSFVGYAGNVIQDTIIPYGIKDTNLISYYFDAGGGFSGVVSLEEGSGTDTIDSYVPHVVLGAKYKGDWGAITGVGAYNSNWEEWAGKLRLDIKPVKNLTLFVMAGYGTDDNVDANFYKPWSGKWALWGGGSYAVTDKTSFNAQITYTDARDFSVAANLAYTIIPGYTITAEVDYFDNFDIDDSDAVGGILRFQRTF
ncbi:porin [Mesorhizobium sp. B2-6-2]|uniref:porin n=1 Tax=Mesorhizobium sp. B2-6-2 TaxID=2589915 RepID=UPI0011271DEF|nr:porin [Mesorhizobium sp. B2-6-2]TPJ77161.1 porin [Mesorhizobium sp. B2-6-2]